MGDADEAAAPLKGSGEDDNSFTSVNIEMVNLSCQMTSMDLLPQKDHVPVRHGKKRVRFSVPDSDDDNTDKQYKVANYRRREAGEFLKAKRRIPKVCLCKLGQIEDTLQRNAAKDTSIGINDTDTEMIKNDEEITDNKRAKRRRQDTANINCNCSTKVEDSTGENEVVHAKSKSGDCASECEDTKKKKKKRVISKKLSVKDDTLCGVKYYPGDKRKVSDIMKEFRALCVCAAKKCKVTPDKAMKKIISKKTCLNNSSLKRKYSKDHKSKVKVKAKAYRGKSASASVKKATEKLKRAKEAKRKRLLKKASEKRKALKRKADLQRKTAQKRKALKIAAEAKRKKSRYIKPRKVRIIPIEREDDVSESLRINLLKFRTFEKAYECKHECCRHYCWDKWEELDIDDVLADFD